MTENTDPQHREPTPIPEPKPAGMALVQLAGDSMELRAQAFAEITERQRIGVLRDAAQQIAATSWGKRISVDMRRDIARYALSVGTDPVRHWEVLGGSLYDKAELWEDLATSQEEFAGYGHEYVHDDDRLPESERQRRCQMRALHGVPEDVAGACVVWIYRHDRPRPAIGVNWAGNRRCYLANEKKEGIKLDPIGEQEPSKSAFTRAFRRAAKLAFPLYFRRTKMKEREEGVPLSALDNVEHKMKAEREEQQRIKANTTEWHGRVAALLDGSYGNPDMRPPDANSTKPETDPETPAPLSEGEEAETPAGLTDAEALAEDARFDE